MFTLFAFAAVVLLLVVAAGLPYPRLPYPQPWHQNFRSADR